MRVLFHAENFDRDGLRLQSVMEKVFTNKGYEVMRTVDELEASLHIPLGERAVAVIMASSVEKLKGFLPLRNLMKNLSVILLVPDYEPETLELAHLLLPRYLEHKASEYRDLAQVLAYFAGQQIPNREADLVRKG